MNETSGNFCLEWEKGVSSCRNGTIFKHVLKAVACQLLGTTRYCEFFPQILIRFPANHVQICVTFQKALKNLQILLCILGLRFKVLTKHCVIYMLDTSCWKSSFKF